VHGYVSIPSDCAELRYIDDVPGSGLRYPRLSSMAASSLHILHKVILPGQLS
jgi:hypothetical protein